MKDSISEFSTVRFPAPAKSIPIALDVHDPAVVDDHSAAIFDVYAISRHTHTVDGEILHCDIDRGCDVDSSAAGEGDTAEIAPSMVTDCAMLTAPKSPASLAVMMPPAVVLANAPVKVAQGEAKVQVLESLPLPETQVCVKVVAEIDAVQNNTATNVRRILRIFMEVSFLEFE